MDFALPPARVLFHQGKALQLVRGPEVSVALVRGVDGDGAILVRERVSPGPVTLRMRFLGERLVARGVIDDHDRSGSRCVLDEAVHPANERSVPRARVQVAGTLFLRPPVLGVPIQAVDLSIAGVAFAPAASLSPAVGDRLMVALELGPRLIRSVVEFVGCDDDRWRARFLHLALSDEAAIASYVLAEQVRQRRLMTASEPQRTSSLDPGERLRYPLVDEVRIEDGVLVLRCRDHEERVPCAEITPESRGTLEDLGGRLRLADPSDVYWVLAWLAVPESVADAFVAAYWALTARATGLGVVAACEFLPTPKETEALVGICSRTVGPIVGSHPQEYLSGVHDLQHDTGVAQHAHSSTAEVARTTIAHSCGIQLTGAGGPQFGRVDPRCLLALSLADDASIAPVTSPLAETEAITTLVSELEAWRQQLRAPEDQVPEA